MDGHGNFFTWLWHVVAGGAIVTTLAGFLPPLAALFGVIWYAIKIRESQTVCAWLAKRRDRRIIKMQAKLVALKLERQMYPTEQDRINDKKLGPGA